jgi:hypothetical protein
MPRTRHSLAWLDYLLKGTGLAELPWEAVNQEVLGARLDHGAAQQPNDRLQDSITRCTGRSEAQGFQQRLLAPGLTMALAQQPNNHLQDSNTCCTGSSEAGCPQRPLALDLTMRYAAARQLSAGQQH